MSIIQPSVEAFEKLWERTAPDFKKVSEEVIRSDWKDRATKSGKNYDELMERVLQRSSALFSSAITEVYARVKAELGEKIYLLFTEPSKLEVLFLKSLMKHGADVKRSKAPEFQACLKKMGVTEADFQFNVEYDIEKTTATIKRTIEAKFKLELLFWVAVDEGRPEEASILLATIELMRTTAEPRLRKEVYLWRFDLAFKMKQVDSCIGAIQQLAKLKGCCKPEEVKPLLTNAIHRLLADTCCKTLHIIPTTLGLNEVRTKGKQAFFDEQAGLFVRGVSSEITDAIWTDPTADLQVLAQKVLEEKRSTFLQVNPFVEDIRGTI